MLLVSVKDNERHKASPHSYVFAFFFPRIHTSEYQPVRRDLGDMMVRRGRFMTGFLGAALLLSLLAVNLLWMRKANVINLYQ
jgi:hypothetical protein